MARVEKLSAVSRKLSGSRWRQPAVFMAVLGIGALLMLATGARAQSVNTKSANGVVKCGDSMYQLVRGTTNGGKSGVRWVEAESAARRFTHRDRRGRLAVIPNMEVHACVSDKLMPQSREEAWIGLRYWCRYRTLQWATGDVRPHSKPSPWAVQWSRYGTCQTAYAGVYYTTGSKRWQAVESKKRFRYLIVEYPPAADTTRGKVEK